MSEKNEAVELKDENLEAVAGGFDINTQDDCEASINDGKALITAYDSVLSDTFYLSLKKSFLNIADSYENGRFDEAYKKTVNLKNSIPMLRNRGNESFNKFVGELENIVLALDFSLRQLCTTDYTY